MEYNGDRIFELLPLSIVKKGGVGGWMEWIEEWMNMCGLR